MKLYQSGEDYLKIILLLHKQLNRLERENEIYDRYCIVRDFSIIDLKVTLLGAEKYACLIEPVISSKTFEA